MPKSIKELTEERNKLLSDNRAMLEAAEKDGRNGLTSDEQKEYDAREVDLDALDDQLQASSQFEIRKQRQQAREAESDLVLPRQTQLQAVRPSTSETLSFKMGRAGEYELEPHHPAYGRASDQYLAEFRKYLAYQRHGLESLASSVGSDPKGGYLVPMATLSGFVKFLDDNVFMRQLATVLPPTRAKSVGKLSYDTDYANADWTAEIPASDYTEDDAARWGNREMTPHLLAKEVQASRKLLQSDSVVPIEQFILSRLGYKFAITEEAAFLTGTGAQQPLGVFTASNDGIPTTRDTTCASATAFTADELIDCEESIKDQYQMRGTWMASRGFRQRCRKLKDSNGVYLLTTDGPSGGGNNNNNNVGFNQLHGRPLIVNENAPNTFTTGQYIAIFGDFSFYYIQDGLDMEIQRLDEIAARRNKVAWIGRKETDAMPVLSEAFARLKLA